MGLNSLTGERVGVSMFQDPEFTTESTRWYYIDNPGIPFHWYGPAALYDNKIILKSGDSLILKYRVMIMHDEKQKDLEAAYHNYIYK